MTNFQIATDKFFFFIPISVQVRLDLRPIVLLFPLSFFRLSSSILPPTTPYSLRPSKPLSNRLHKHVCLRHRIDPSDHTDKIFYLPMLQDKPLRPFRRGVIRIKTADLETGLHHRLLASRTNRFFQENHRLTVSPLTSFRRVQVFLRFL